MKENAIRAKKYRERAAKIRTIAEDVRGDEWRRLLLKVATDYNRLARHFAATDSTANEDAAPRRRSG